MNTTEKFLGSGFFTGYIPVASGTFGSLAALLIYWIPGFERSYILVPTAIMFTIIGIPLGTKFEKVYGKDPAECTIDEVAGMWVSLFFLPKSILISVITFVLWRVIDIFKPPPVNLLERLPGGTGIMLDDIMGGIYACAIMHLLVHYFHLG